MAMRREALQYEHGAYWRLRALKLRFSTPKSAKSLLEREALGVWRLSAPRMLKLRFSTPKSAKSLSEREAPASRRG